MSTVLSSPEITGIQRLFEIYVTLPERKYNEDTFPHFYDFLRENTSERQLFLEIYCDFSFMQIDNIVILKLSPKE
jgi:hypothetical protein